MKQINFERIVANRYNHLLVMLMAFFVVAPFIEQGQHVWGLRLISFALLATIILCLRVCVQSRRLFWVCTAIAVAAPVIKSFSAVPASRELRHILYTISTLIYCFFILVTVIALMKSMFRDKKVTSKTIVGGICIYLLVGILWAEFYILLRDFVPDAIVFTSEPSVYYFSFTTLTTLGYGDIVPTSTLAKILANGEAVAGQVYLAVFIARLVGLHIAHELRETKE